MKKLALIIALMMILPGAAFGLEMLNDSAMEDVTGQVGVHIGFDDVQIFMNIERIAWIDQDGFSDHSGDGWIWDNTQAWTSGHNATAYHGSGGAVGIENFQLDVLHINAIVASQPGLRQAAGSAIYHNGVMNFRSTTNGEIPLQFNYGNTATLNNGGLVIAPANTVFGIERFIQRSRSGDAITHGRELFSALTIDATSQLEALSAIEASNAQGVSGTGATNTNIGGVNIGLPTAEFYIGNMVFTPAFYNVTNVGVANRAANAYDVDSLQEYGTFGFEGIAFTVLGGNMEIAPH